MNWYTTGMENLEQNEAIEKEQSPFHTVTPLSKYLAMVLFIILPFLGGWIGYTYAPEKVVETERVVTQEIEKEIDIFENVSFSENELTIIEAPELLVSEEYAYKTPFHIFYNERHLISTAGPCRVSNEVVKISETLDFPDKEQYDVISKITCFLVAAGTETLLLKNVNPTVGAKRIIHYPTRDCGLAPPDCQSEGTPISL
jgi:hypothetical protein